MGEQGRDNHGHGVASLICPACGTSYGAGDRFCAECGAALPPAEDDAASAPLTPDPAASPEPLSEARPRENSLWVLGAAPTAVIGGGLLLLGLAAALLFIGQRDDTGTIVMLSICLTPLALLVTAIGVARVVAGALRRG